MIWGFLFHRFCLSLICHIVFFMILLPFSFLFSISLLVQIIVAYLSVFLTATELLILLEYLFYYWFYKDFFQTYLCIFVIAPFLFCKDCHFILLKLGFNFWSNTNYFLKLILDSNVGLTKSFCFFCRFLWD